MENNELHTFGDLSMSELMHALMAADDVDSDEELDNLYHHGIKGMKWGILRYQNRDGTLTEAGKKRYAKTMAKVKEQEKILKNKAETRAKLEKLNSRVDAVNQQKQAERDAEKAAKAARKAKKGATNSEPKRLSAKDLSDEELFAITKRLDAERMYNDAIYKHVESSQKLRLQQVPAKKVSKGQKFLTEKILPSLGEAATEAVKTAGKEYLNKKVKNLLGLNEKDKDAKKTFDLEKVMANMNNMSSKELEDVKNRLANVKSIELEYDRQEHRREQRAEKQAAEAAAAAKAAAEEAARRKREGK